MSKLPIASAGLLAVVLAAAPGLSAPASPPALAASCASPVMRNDSAATILRRFGANARRETLPGAEGETMPGVVLYPRDPRRRIEVTFMDSRMVRVRSLIVRGRTSAWSVGGLSLGDGIERITARNGQPFTLAGFEWDYGGYVTNLRGGALQRLPGGCRVGIRLSLPEGLTTTPEALMGDVQLESTNAALRRAKTVVSELILNF